MSKKKVLKGAFHSPTDGSFTQKKRVILRNIKHSGDEKDISLSKSGPSGSTYSDVDSLSDDDEDVDITGVDGKSLLDLAVTTLKAKCIDTNTILGSPDFTIDDDKIVLPPCLFISLEKKKSFALDINLSAVEEKSATAKTQFIRKLFSSVNGFGGGATTPSKFEGIIKSTFISEKSMDLATLLAKKKGINVNSDLKRQKIRSDWAVIIKEIPINMSKDMIITTVSEFGEIKSIKIQLIGMWQKAVVEFAKLDQAESLASKWSFLIGKNSVHVAKTVGNCETWASRDQFRVLLFTLLMGTTAHDLDILLERAGGKTCIINRSMKTGNKICCAVVSFAFDNDLESAFRMKPIFNGVKLSWARINLIRCEKCGHFGYSALELLLVANWAQVVSISKSSGSAHSGSGPSLSSYGLLGLGGIFLPEFIISFGLSDHLVILERSLELLADQVSEIMKKLSFVELVSLASKSFVLPPVVLVFLDSVVDSDMTLDDALAFPILLPVVVVDKAANFSSSSFKVLTPKMDGLKSKLVVLEMSVESVLEKLDQLCSSLGVPTSIISQ
ncbi:hypothetical protein G9A89_008301 [Geosiphon pyriformis]|nr:hypothetical protein G9A89_008301 [Geosiphon pyriformis]